MEKEEILNRRFKVLKNLEIEAWSVDGLIGRRFKKNGKYVDVEYKPWWSEKEWGNAVIEAVQGLL